MSAASETDAIAKSLALASRRLANRSGWTAAEQRECAIHTAAYVKRLRKFERMASSGSERTYVEQEWLLRSMLGRFCSLLRAHAQLNRSAQQTKPIAWSDLWESSARLDLFRPIDEPMIAMRRPKTQGGHRLVTAQGPQRRAAGLLVSDTLQVRHVTPLFDYCRAGRGRTTAIDAMCAAVTSGYSRWLTFDVADFYPSVRSEHLGWLRLPKAVLENVVLMDTANIVPSHNGGIKKEAARLGLPQGAKLSAMVGSALMGRLLSDIPGAGTIITYCDDGAIGVSTAASEQKLAEALHDRFSLNKAGPLTFKFLNAHHASDGIPFLGYFVRAKKGDSQVHVHPSKGAFRRLREEGRRRLTRLGASSLGDQGWWHLKRYARHWRKGHPRWAPSRRALSRLIYTLEEILRDHRDQHPSSAASPAAANFTQPMKTGEN